MDYLIEELEDAYELSRTIPGGYGQVVDALRSSVTEIKRLRGVLSSLKDLMELTDDFPDEALDRIEEVLKKEVEND